MATLGERDPFRTMLLWSLVLHALLFSAIGLAARYQPGRVLPMPENVAFVIPGVPGPTRGIGGGSPAPPPEPKPEPEPEPKKEPSVVRPTKEQRDQLPMPDAKPAPKKRQQEPKPDSGLRGRDAASAASAKLQSNPSPMPGLGLGGVGGGSAFDQEFEYAYYVQQMLSRIHQNWQRTAVRGTTTVVVRFTILRDGSVEDVEVERSSRVPLLDRASLRAVLLAAPMPPLPNSYPREHVGIHLQFTYTDQS